MLSKQQFIFQSKQQFIFQSKQQFIFQKMMEDGGTNMFIDFSTWNEERLKEAYETFQDSGKIRIRNLFTEEYASILHKNIIQEKNWNLASGIQNVKYEKRWIPTNQKANQLQIQEVNKAFGQDKFSYHFLRSMNNINPNMIEFGLRQFLQSDDFLGFLNSITGLNLTKCSTCFLSRYAAGDFLSPHSDKGNGKCAFVIQMTQGWKPQYGGVLHFMNEERTQIIESFVPDFNTLTLFNVPEPNGIPHFISHVAPNVSAVRYAITGWFS